MNSDEARQRAEQSFKTEDRARDSRKAPAEYEALALAIREKPDSIRLPAPLECVITNY